MTDYELAKQRAIAKLAVYIHTTVFVIVNVTLITINLILTPQNIWFVWPLLGWGLGLLAHTAVVYFPSQWGGQLMKRMIRRELDKQEASEN